VLVLADIAFCWWLHDKGNIDLFDDKTGWVITGTVVALIAIGFLFRPLWIGAAGCAVVANYRLAGRHRSFGIASAVFALQIVACAVVVIGFLLVALAWLGRASPETRTREDREERNRENRRHERRERERSEDFQRLEAAKQRQWAERMERERENRARWRR